VTDRLTKPAADLPGRRAWLAVAALLGVFVVGLLIGRTVQPEQRVVEERTAKQGARGAIARPSRRGAVRAATRFLESLSLDVLLDERRRHRLVTSMSAPAARPVLLRLYAAEHRRVANDYSGGVRVARAALLGYRVEDFSDGRASVAIWSVALGVSDVRAAGIGWSTTTVRVVWRRSRWLIAGVSQVAGPSPATTLELLEPAAASFTEYRHVP
jgi:hypothetical protein